MRKKLICKNIPLMSFLLSTCWTAAYGQDRSGFTELLAGNESLAVLEIAMGKPLGLDTNRTGFINAAESYGSTLRSALDSGVISDDLAATLMERAANTYTVLVPYEGVSEPLSSCERAGFGCQIEFTESLMSIEGVAVVNAMGEFVSPDLETLLLSAPGTII